MNVVTQDCFEMRHIGAELEGVPEAVNLLEGPRVQRQVLTQSDDN